MSGKYFIPKKRSLNDQTEMKTAGKKVKTEETKVKTEEARVKSDETKVKTEETKGKTEETSVKIEEDFDDVQDRKGIIFPGVIRHTSSPDHCIAYVIN